MSDFFFSSTPLEPENIIEGEKASHEWNETWEWKHNAHKGVKCKKRLLIVYQGSSFSAVLPKRLASIVSTPIWKDGLHQIVLKESLSMPLGMVGLLSTVLSVSTYRAW